MQNTTNLKLQKPASDEKYSVATQNVNMDILDAEIKKLEEADQTLLPKSVHNAHISDNDNPHKVTKTQLGLSHVTNVRQIPAITEAVTANGVPVFDGNGYQLKDSGFLIGSSVPSNAKFTDTVYEHPKSEILTGTYSSVFVNEEGHVVHGENPTTLAGYGITDGEIKGSSSTALLDAKKYTDVQVAAIQGGSNLKRMIVAALPTANIDQNMIYLVPRIDAVSDNRYNEYINLDSTAAGWEYIGNTAIDLADYYNKSEQNRLFLLKDRVVQENVNDGSKVPSSAVLYGNCNSLLEKIDEVERKLADIDRSVMKYKQVLTVAEINKVGDMTPYVGNTSYGINIGLLDGWYSIIYLPHASADGYGVQVVFPYTAPDVPKWRNCRAGTWSAWQII